MAIKVQLLIPIIATVAAVVQAQTCPCVRDFGVCDSIMFDGQLGDLDTCSIEQKMCGGCQCVTDGTETDICDVVDTMKYNFVNITGNGQPCSTSVSPTALCPPLCSGGVQIFVDGDAAGCIKSIPANTDVDEAYGYADFQANNIENLEYDYINLRFVNTLVDGELHFCTIYGNWQIGQQVNPNDPTLSRQEKATITAAFPLGIEIRDDPGDDYAGDGTTQVDTDHEHYAYKSDGFCLGPLLGDGSSIKAQYYDLNNMLGVNVQTYNSATGAIENLVTWNFADNRPASDLQPDGRSNGDEAVLVEFKPSCVCAA